MLSVLNLQRERNISVIKNMYKKVDCHDVKLLFFRRFISTARANHIRQPCYERRAKQASQVQLQVRTSNKRLKYIINRQLSIRKDAL